MKKTEKVSTDTRMTALIRRMGERLAQASGAKFNWEFTYFDAPKTVNAFCLPGGKVGVYSGIIPVAKTEAGLAAVVGHEIGHAIARHGAERMSQGIVAQVGLEAVNAAFADQKYRGLILGAMGLGLQVGVLLPYSRAHESEADKLGLIYMARAGYDPREAPKLWERMAQLSGGQKSLEILSTHPNSEKRARALEDDLKEVLPIFEKSEKQPALEL